MSPSATARLAFLVGLLILLFKFWIASLTHSQAVLSDALEGIVNVVSAFVTLILLNVSNKPADGNHPYGHGKLEYFSAVFEGGLVSAAGIIVIMSAGASFLAPSPLHSLDIGIALVALAGLLNLALGVWLRRMGEQLSSAALAASGTHVISDFWTSLAVVVGVAVVWVTGLAWLDSVIAIALGIVLTYTGTRIARSSIGGLLDEEDAGILTKLAYAFSIPRIPGVIGVHDARVIRAGNYHFIDAHVVVPEFWEIARAHDMSNTFAREVLRNYPTSGEIHFHLDPCRRAFCSNCDLHECPIRRHPFVERVPYTGDGIRAPLGRDLGKQIPPLGEPS